MHSDLSFYRVEVSGFACWDEKFSEASVISRILPDKVYPLKATAFHEGELMTSPIMFTPRS